MVLIIFLFLWTTLSAAPLDNYRVTRDYFGDGFTLNGNECGETACQRDGRFAAQVPGEDCSCQCAPSHYIYRDDIEDCVEYVAECPLAVFLRPYMAEKLPVVSLPLTGQLVYPGAHFQFPEVGNVSSMSICEVSYTEYMTTNGWERVAQGDDQEPVFGIFQDGGNTFLQWLGRDNQRLLLQQHLVLVRLRCQDQGVAFDSCTALRIGWSPGLNVALTEPFWIRRNNFIIIGLCVGILGLTYVFAICIYMKVRRKNARKCNNPRIASHQSAFRDLRNKNVHRKCPQVYNMMKRDLWIHQKNCLKAEKYPSSIQFNERKPQEEMENEGSDSYLARQNFVLSREYFEPEMLASPPPLATELLHRVRQTISLTMRRIKNLKFRPTLVIIPEEDYYYPNDRVTVSAGSQQEHRLETISGLTTVPNAITEPSFPIPRPPPRKYRPKPKPNESTKDNSVEESSNQLTKFDLFRQDLFDKVNKLKDIPNKSDMVHVLEGGGEETDFDGPAGTNGNSRISRRTLLNHIEAGIDINEEEDGASVQDDERSQNKDLEEITIQDNTDNSPDAPEMETSDIVEDCLSIDIEDLYRQWSSQLALKLLEQKVPNVDRIIEGKETNALTQFLKECRSAISRFGYLNVPKSQDLKAQVHRDNWTLRKERDSERSSVLSSRTSDTSTFRLDSLTDFSESSIEAQTSQDSLTNSEGSKPEAETSGVSSGGDELHSLGKSADISITGAIPSSPKESAPSDNTMSVDIDSLEDSDNSFDLNSFASDVTDLSFCEDFACGRGIENLEVSKEIKTIEWKHVCERKHHEEELKTTERSSRKIASNRNRKHVCKSRRTMNGTCKDYIRYCKSRTGTFSLCSEDESNNNDDNERTEHCAESGVVTLIGMATSK